MILKAVESKFQGVYYYPESTEPDSTHNCLHVQVPCSRLKVLVTQSRDTSLFEFHSGIFQSGITVVVVKR